DGGMASILRVIAGVLLLDVFTRLLADFLPRLPRGAVEHDIGFAGGVGLLALEFLITLPTTGIEFTGVQGVGNRAARFAVMPAIVKAALAGEFLDVGECFIHRIGAALPELDFAH